MNRTGNGEGHPPLAGPPRVPRGAPVTKNRPETTRG